MGGMSGTRAAYLLDLEYLSADVHGNEEVMTGFWRTVNMSAEDVAKVVTELYKIREGKGTFATNAARQSARTAPAYEWWASFGASVPV